MIMTENFPQINVRHQPTDPGSTENTKQNKFYKTIPKHTIFKLHKIKDKVPEEARGKNTSPTEEQREELHLCSLNYSIISMFWHLFGFELIIALSASTCPR